jgi:hypothetical protein
MGGRVKTEAPMETRIFRLESEVRYLQASIADIRAEVRKLRSDHDIELNRALNALLNYRRVEQDKSSVLLRSPIDAPWVLLHLVVLATLLIFMWMGFGWI